MFTTLIISNPYIFIILFRILFFFYIFFSNVTIDFLSASINDWICYIWGDNIGSGSSGNGGSGGSGGSPQGPSGNNFVPHHPTGSTSDRENVILELEEVANQNLKNKANYSEMSHQEKRDFCIKDMKKNLWEATIDVLRERRTGQLNPTADPEYRVLYSKLTHKIANHPEFPNVD